MSLNMHITLSMYVEGATPCVNGRSVCQKERPYKSTAANLFMDALQDSADTKMYTASATARNSHCLPSPIVSVPFKNSKPGI